jgi:hypothetical protein
MEKVVARITYAFLLVLAMTGGISDVAYAREDYLKWFNDTYEAKGTVLDDCITCHVSSNPDGNSADRNPYGDDFEDKGHDFAAIELKDSDGDGSSNIAEIWDRTFPGGAGSVSGGDSGCFITAAACGFVSWPRASTRTAPACLTWGNELAEKAVLVLLASSRAVVLILRVKGSNWL